jgi:ABC-type amino acid transport system permease subunit
VWFFVLLPHYDWGTRGLESAVQLLTIDECVENVIPVLLHQVVDVTKDTAVHMVSFIQLAELRSSSGAKWT